MMGLDTENEIFIHLLPSAIYSGVAKPYCTSIVACSGKCKHSGRHSLCPLRISGRALVVETFKMILVKHHTIFVDLPMIAIILLVLTDYKNWQ